MRTISLFLLGCLVCSTLSMKLDNVFEEFTDTEFGQNLVESIQLQLESGATIDTLITMIRGVRDDLRSQLADATAAHEVSSDECATDLADYTSRVDQANADFTKFTGLSAFDTSTLASRVDEKANKVAELKERETMSADMQAARDAETARWEAIQAEHRLVQDMIEDVRAIVRNRLQVDEGEFLETNMFM